MQDRFTSLVPALTKYGATTVGLTLLVIGVAGLYETLTEGAEVADEAQPALAGHSTSLMPWQRVPRPTPPCPATSCLPRTPCAVVYQSRLSELFSAALLWHVGGVCAHSGLESQLPRSMGHKDILALILTDCDSWTAVAGAGVSGSAAGVTSTSSTAPADIKVTSNLSTLFTGIVFGLQPDALFVIVPALALPTKAAATAYILMFVFGTVAAMGSYTAFIGKSTFICRLTVRCERSGRSSVAWR